MLIYRRHSNGCPYRSKGRKEIDRCGCPFWLDGEPLKQPKSLNTRDKARALEMMAEIEKGTRVESVCAPIEAAVTLTDARTVFFANLTRREISAETKRKHETLWRQVLAFAASRKLGLVIDLDASEIDKFMETWQDGANARGKKLERLRQFFKFAVGREWIGKDPTQGMKGPKVKRKQTPPYTPNETIKILAAAEKKIHGATGNAKPNALRARALILFLRFSGLRSSDAVGCQTGWVKDGRVQLHTRKNNRFVDVQLPPHVIAELKAIPAMSDLYYFWTGQGKLETAVKDWQKRLADIFHDAKIENAHCHRFRDSFAVSLLERGESLQTVADALGDTLAVAQKHYNAWSKKRQERQDEAVRGAWQHDAVLEMLDGKDARVN
jgi:integrase